jgi:hypothetical protein
VGLADSLAAASPKHATDRCSLRSWAVTLEPDDATALWGMLDSEDVALRTAARLISENGHPVSTSTIANHRRGECLTCERHRPWV